MISFRSALASPVLDLFVRGIANATASGVFSPITMRGLTLRNRVLRSAANEGMCPDGHPSQALIDHHKEMAAGHVGLTTVAYAAVSPEGSTTSNQLPMRPDVQPFLRRLSDAVHDEGGAVSIQLTHAGYIGDRNATGLPSMGPTGMFNPMAFHWSRKMTTDDIYRVADAYAKAASLSVGAGFDAVEVHCGHGYLLSQFLSPYTNRRRDRWGGSLDARLRFPIEVLRRVRDAVGPKVPILVKMNMQDGFRGGATLADGIRIAQAFEAEGVDAIIPSGGFVSVNGLYMMRGDVPLWDMVRYTRSWAKKVALALFGPFVIHHYRFEENFFREEALRFMKSVKIPVALLGGVRTLDGMEEAIRDGFGFVAMARPLYREPDLIKRMEEGKATESLCIPCNKCIACTLGDGASECPLRED